MRIGWGPSDVFPTKADIILRWLLVLYHLLLMVVYFGFKSKPAWFQIAERNVYAIEVIIQWAALMLLIVVCFRLFSINSKYVVACGLSLRFTRALLAIALFAGAYSLLNPSSFAEHNTIFSGAPALIIALMEMLHLRVQPDELNKSNQIESAPAGVSET